MELRWLVATHRLQQVVESTTRFSSTKLTSRMPPRASLPVPTSFSSSTPSTIVSVLLSVLYSSLLDVDNKSVDIVDALDDTS
jgi:hypothetical protein